MKRSSIFCVYNNLPTTPGECLVHHRRKLRVAQRRKTARQRRQQKGERDGRTGAGPANGGESLRSVHDQIHHRSVQDGFVAQRLTGGGGAGAWSRGLRSEQLDELVDGEVRIPDNGA